MPATTRTMRSRTRALSVLFSVGVLALLLCPARGALASPTGCDFGDEPSGDATPSGALDLVSNGWVDVEPDAAGRLFVKATIVTATLQSDPVANLPAGADAATWELRLVNTAQRPSNGASDVYLRARVDAAAGTRFDAGWLEAGSVGGGVHVNVPYVPVTGSFTAGSPGYLTISAPADQLGFFASGAGYGDVVTDVFSVTAVGTVPEDAAATVADRAPDSGAATGRYRVSPGNHTCIDVATWPSQSAPLQADAFGDSLGVNVRLQYSPSNYNSVDGTVTKGQQYPKIEQALVAGGFRYIRDFLDHATAANPFYRHLYDAHGIRTDLTYQLGITQEQVLGTARAIGAEALVSLEGVNEPDCVGCTSTPDPNFPTSTRAEQRAIYAAVKADPALASITMLPPALATPAGYATLGDLSDVVDAGNIHTYAYTEPYQRAGVLDQYLGLTQRVSGSKPIEETETGYMTTKVPGAPGTALNYHVVSERAHGVYIAKTMLTNLASGVRRTYVSELLDQEPFVPGDLGSFGLLRSDFTPKPAYTAIQNLSTLLDDRGPAFSPAPFSYAVTGDQIRHVLLEKRDGSRWLAVWRDDRIYASQVLGREQALYGDLHPPATPAAITFGAPADVTSYLPLQSTGPAARQSGVTALSVSVPPDQVLLYEVREPGSTPVAAVPDLPLPVAAVAPALAACAVMATRARRRHTGV